MKPHVPFEITVKLHRFNERILHLELVNRSRFKWNFNHFREQHLEMVCACFKEKSNGHEKCYRRYAADCINCEDNYV